MIRVRSRVTELLLLIEGPELHQSTHLDRRKLFENDDTTKDTNQNAWMGWDGILEKALELGSGQFDCLACDRGGRESLSTKARPKTCTLSYKKNTADPLSAILPLELGFTWN